GSGRSDNVGRPSGVAMAAQQRAGTARQPIGRAQQTGWSPTSLRALIRVIFPGRHLTIIGLAAVLPFVGVLGDRRWWLSAVCLAVLLPLDLFFERQARRRGEFSIWMPVVNQLIASLVVVLSPEALPGVGVILCGDNALTALIFGLRRS